MGGPCEGRAKFPLSGADKAGQVLTIHMYICIYIYVYVSLCMRALYTHVTALTAALHLPQTARRAATRTAKLLELPTVVHICR